jgi:hypothetical protein
VSTNTADDGDNYQRWLREDPEYHQWLDGLNETVRRNEPMSLLATNKGGGDFKLVPPGSYFALCNMIVDVGFQPGYKGKPQHKVYFRFEIPDETLSYTKDGREIEGPMTIGSFYTLSLKDGAYLRRDLENWRTKPFTDAELVGFDVFNVLGHACQVQVTHNKGKDNKTYANISAIVALSKEQKVRAKTYVPANPLISYSLSEPNEDSFAKLPDWLKKKIGDALPDPNETAETPESKAETFDDDIPF